MDFFYLLIDSCDVVVYVPLCGFVTAGVFDEVRGMLWSVVRGFIGFLVVGCIWFVVWVMLGSVFLMLG